MKKSLGFTLIELLVVISIISLLSSVVLVTIQDSRNKAKATAYNSYMKEVQKALELYRLENKQYPLEPCSSRCSISLENLINNYLSSYISFQDPDDSFNFSTNYPYYYVLNNSDTRTLEYSCGSEFAGEEIEYMIYGVTSPRTLGLDFPIFYNGDRIIEYSYCWELNQ